MLKEQIKQLFDKNSVKNGKKKMETLVVFIIILIVTIIAINVIWNDKEETPKDDTNYAKTLANMEVSNSKQDENVEYNTLETNLENILSRIEGVGKVKVLVTYSQSSQTIAMYNENSKNSSIEEKDSGGGTRITQETDTQKDIIYKEENGKKVPITQTVINPKVEGAIVTAQGANDANVKNNIIQAVEAVTGIATHKIQVFEMKKDEGGK